MCLRITVLVSQLLFASFAYAQTAVWKGRTYSSRVCSNPNCAMCASIQRQIAAQLRHAPVVQSPAKVAPGQAYRTETRRVPVTRRVKRCNGRTCWYETVTEYVTQTVRVPVSSPIGHKKPVAKEEPQKPDLMTVTELQPTPPEVVVEMLSKMGLTSDSKLFDLGCGDGRFLLTAASYYGTQGFGVDLNPESVRLARRNAELNSVSSLVTIFEGDIREFDASEATHVAMYLYPELMSAVVPNLSPGTVVASYQHEIPGVETERRRVGDNVYYIGVVR